MVITTVHNNLWHHLFKRFLMIFPVKAIFSLKRTRRRWNRHSIELMTFYELFFSSKGEFGDLVDCIRWTGFGGLHLVD
jgi:hypothetical protein